MHCVPDPSGYACLNLFPFDPAGRPVVLQRPQFPPETLTTLPRCSLHDREDPPARKLNPSRTR